MYGIEHKVLALPFSGALLLQAYVVRSWIGTYLAPAALFPLAWFFFTFFPLVMLFDAPINAWSIFYIWLSAMAFSLSALPLDWKWAIKKNRLAKATCPAPFESTFVRTCLYVSALGSVVFSMWTMINNGWGIEEILFDLLATSGRFAALRGIEGMEYGLIGTLSIFFTYLAPVLGGLIASAQQTGKAKAGYFVVAMAPSIFTMVTQSSKLVFLISLFFYLAAVMLDKLYRSRLSLFKGWHLTKILVGALILFPLVLVSFVSREGYSDLSDLNETVKLLKYALSSYSLGQIYAFSDFFSFYIGMPAMATYKNDFESFGAYTFASVFETLGIGKNFPPGLYEETGRFPGVFETNIFTVFRSLIYDFGGVGSIIFMFISGFVANAFFYKLLVGRRSWLSSTVYVVTVVTILMGYLMSVFMARYMYLNAFAFYLILRINSWLQTRRLLDRRKLRAAIGEPAPPTPPLLA